MRQASIALAGSAALLLGGCVQTRQYADTQFTPPAGDYKLLVMRPDISVGSVTTGGLTEPRADWTEAARVKLLAALRAQQAARGGKLMVLDRRDSLPGISAETIAELERLHGAVGNSIALHKYLGEDLPTKRRKGLDWTLGEQAIALGQRTGMDYALFIHAEDSFASTGRAALQVLGMAGCLVGFCAPGMSGGSQFAYASLVDLRTGKVAWFNVLQSRIGDIRTDAGAAEMIERLLGRMKPGRAVRRASRPRS